MLQAYTLIKINLGLIKSRGTPYIRKLPEICAVIDGPRNFRFVITCGQTVCKVSCNVCCCYVFVSDR